MVEAGDFSPVLPLSIQDLIWIRIAQIQKRNSEIETQNAFFTAIADCRSIAIDTNFYARAAALKDTGKNKVEPLDIYDLPSGKQAVKNMTDEEFRKWKMDRFLDGKVVPNTKEDFL